MYFIDRYATLEYKKRMAGKGRLRQRVLARKQGAIPGLDFSWMEPNIRLFIGGAKAGFEGFVVKKKRWIRVSKTQKIRH